MSLNIFLLFFIISLTALFLGQEFVFLYKLPEGDIAVDMLQANTIPREALLFGNYSRFKFHHPGPFWFYYNWRSCKNPLLLKLDIKSTCVTILNRYYVSKKSKIQESSVVS
jgi:hypothetical protein